MSMIATDNTPKLPTRSNTYAVPRKTDPREKPLVYQRGIDVDNKRVVFLTIRNAPKETVKLFEEDFDRLMEAGYDHGWHFAKTAKGHKYLWVNIGGGGKKRAIARLILDPPLGKQIKFSDGNSKNLRRDNLTTQGITRFDPNLNF